MQNMLYGFEAYSRNTIRSNCNIAKANMRIYTTRNKKNFYQKHITYCYRIAFNKQVFYNTKKAGVLCSLFFCTQY